MSTGVFTKEIEETSSASSCVADLDDSKSPKVLNECFPSCCPLLVAEVQVDTLNKMLDEEALGPKHSVAQLIDECSPKDMSKRYVTTTSLVRSSNKPKIEFETCEDLYLAEFFLELATIEDLYYEKQILEIEDCIPQSTMPSDELMIVVEHGKFTCELNTHNILCQFSFNRDDIVLVLGAATNLCVWDPGISFKSKAFIGYTVNTKPLLLLGSIGTLGFIAYSNSMTQVWDPGQQRYEMVIPKSKVHDKYSEMNHMFDDSSQRATSREIQPIAPLDILRLPKLFRFPQRLSAQLIGGDFALRKKISEQASALKMAPEGKEVTPIVCIAWLQGCIKSTTNLIEQALHNFSTLEEIMVFFGAHGVPTSYGLDLEFEYILVGYGADEFLMLIMHDILDHGD
ncbi:hypothetical protein KY290_030939 [Solanum tuberosum]|uniref:Uncharacterized protein n=1 Tax=Solanum tuberosum TaxID=4113 RepID=A0ABQ7U7Q5_SOLTU|nr:hypothetical protein KY290_030939 [Solanum tuberosum]